MNIKNLLAGMLLLVGATACKTPTNVTYFQDVKTGTEITPAAVRPIRVQKENKLQIMVTTSDPALSMLFNLVVPQNLMNGATASKGVIQQSSGSSQTAVYTVDPQGNVNFPVLGKIHVEGLTRSEIATTIEKKLVSEDLVKDPIVTVEFVNSGIAILGEVKAPGRYEFNRDRMNIIDAIAMAGDLTMNGERENILVMRTKEDGSQEGYRVNLLDMKSLMTSPVYYLEQDDVIYVSPNDKAKRETTPNGNAPYTPSFWITLGSSALSLITLILTIAK